MHIYPWSLCIAWKKINYAFFHQIIQEIMCKGCQKMDFCLLSHDQETQNIQYLWWKKGTTFLDFLKSQQSGVYVIEKQLMLCMTRLKLCCELEDLEHEATISKHAAILSFIVLRTTQTHRINTGKKKCIKMWLRRYYCTST